MCSEATCLFTTNPSQTRTYKYYAKKILRHYSLYSANMKFLLFCVIIAVAGE